MTAFHFELGKHASLRIVRDGPPKDKSLSKMAFVIPFEHVLVGDVPEDRDSFVQNNVDFDLGFLFRKRKQDRIRFNKGNTNPL